MKFVDQKFIRPYERGEILRIVALTNKDVKSRNFILHKRFRVDLVAGDFNGTAWRSTNRCNRSTIEEAFSDCNLPTPPGPTPLGGPGWIPDLWTDVCGFLKPADSDRYWKVRKHGAFAIPRKAPGLPKIGAATTRHGST